MEPAAIQQKLGTGIQKILALESVPAARKAEADADAFEVFRDAVKAARRDEELLGGFAEEDMSKALAFTRRRGSEKKIQSRQAKECLKILLMHAAWHRVAHTEEDLKESLREFLADSPDMQARLDAPPAGTADTQARAAKPAPSRGDTEDEEQRIRTLLRGGRDTMQRFGWAFPCDALADDFDTATGACRAFYDALNRLSSICRTGSENAVDVASAEKVLSTLQIEWREVLRFLCSMYESGTRRSYRCRITFIATTLEQFCPQFRAAVAERGLPWRKVSGDKVQVAATEAAEEAAHSPRVSEEEPPGDFAPVEPPRPVQQQRQPQQQNQLHQHQQQEQQQPQQPQQLRLDQTGRFAICNGTSEELVFYVEQTEEEFRLRPGADQTFLAQCGTVDVRINRPGFLGFTSLRTRLAKVRLEHQNFYNVTSSPGGGVSIAIV